MHNNNYNIFIIVDKKLFFLYIDLFNLFINNSCFKIERNLYDYIIFYGKFKNPFKIKEIFTEKIVKNIHKESNGHILYMLYSYMSQYSVPFVVDFLNYCKFKKYKQNILNIDFLIDEYIEYKKEVNNIGKLLDDSTSISFYYQTIVKPDNKWLNFKATSYELLSRIKSVEGNIINPSVFLKIIEENPVLFDKFEQNVLNSFIDITHIYKEKLPIHVNFSPKFLVDNYNNLLKIHSEQVKKIIIEINERFSGEIVNKTDLIDVIKLLKNHGFNFVFDDFGEGVNNIEFFLQIYKYLKGFKIGIGLFDLIFTATDTFYITEEVNQGLFLVKFFESFQYLANLSVYIEGIEDEKKINLFKGINIFNKDCYLQGFYFHKPEKLFLPITVDN